GGRRQAPGAGIGLAGGVERGIGETLQAALNIPVGAGVAQDGEGDAHRSVLKAGAGAWAGARSSWRAFTRARAALPSCARALGSSSSRAVAAAKAAASPI